MQGEDNFSDNVPMNQNSPATILSYYKFITEIFQALKIPAETRSRICNPFCSMQIANNAEKLPCEKTTSRENKTKVLTLRSSDDRKPPIHMKHLSAGVFHIPDKMWKISALAAVPLSLYMSSNCAVTLSTIVRSSVSPA